jgi:hypothetical protein
VCGYISVAVSSLRRTDSPWHVEAPEFSDRGLHARVSLTLLSLTQISPDIQQTTVPNLSSIHMSRRSQYYDAVLSLHYCTSIECARFPSCCSRDRVAIHLYIKHRKFEKTEIASTADRGGVASFTIVNYSLSSRPLLCLLSGSHFSLKMFSRVDLDIVQWFNTIQRQHGEKSLFAQRTRSHVCGALPYF